jgi:hypothetical protein
MGLFGPSQITITPADFVRIQVDEMFSSKFIDAETDEFAHLSKASLLLQGVSLPKYLRERQNVIYNLFHIAWCRTIPEAIFIQHSSVMTDDPRIKGVNSGVYDMALSRAQEAGMDTFGYFSRVFIAQIIPQEVETNDPDYTNLYVIYGTDFTHRFISFGGLIKQYRFVT